MAEQARELVVFITHGVEHELSSLGFTVANGGMTAGLNVSVFLLSNGVDLVRRRAADMTHVEPCEPLASLIRDFLSRGGRIWACVLCVKARGYTDADLLEGV